MKYLKHETVLPAEQSEPGNFNAGEHIYVEIEPGQAQTVSCRLPNGCYVTFAFLPGQDNEMECVDIHSDVGPEVARPRGNGDDPGRLQHLIGFGFGGDSFDTRTAKNPCTLSTLLLHSRHYTGKA